MRTQVRSEERYEDLGDGGREGRRMYLGPIYWIMDDSSLRLLEEEWRERMKEREGMMTK